MPETADRLAARQGRCRNRTDWCHGPASLPLCAPRPTTTGILCLISGIAIFSVQDLILKLLSGDYPLHQAMVIRPAMPFLLWIVHAFDGSLATIATGAGGRCWRADC